MEEKYDLLMKLDSGLLSRVIALNCAIKAGVVEADERESGMRQILNYGHTIGHAVEKLSNYRISHGRAVAIGMAIEGDIAARQGAVAGSDHTVVHHVQALFRRNPYALKLDGGSYIRNFE